MDAPKKQFLVIKLIDDPCGESITRTENFRSQTNTDSNPTKQFYSATNRSKPPKYIYIFFFFSIRNLNEPNMKLRHRFQYEVNQK